MAWGRRFWANVGITAGIVIAFHLFILPGCYIIQSEAYIALDDLVATETDWCDLIWNAVFIGGVLALMILFGREAWRWNRND